MSFAYDYLAALMVSVVSAAIVWLFGGTRGDVLTPVVPWFLVFLFEMLMFFPQRRGRESTHEARKRVWRSLKNDVLVWIILLLLIILAVPFINNGLCNYCDARLIANGVRPEPKVPIVPYCVDRLDHLNVFWWFSLSLLAVLVVRHSLARRGKRFVVAAIVWNAALVAILGFLQTALNAPGPYWIPLASAGNVGTFFATFGYPNMAGSYFVLTFGLSVAMWRDRRERIATAERQRDISSTAPRRPRMFWRRNVYLIPSAICFYAAICTLSRAAIMLVSASAMIYAGHAFMMYLTPKHRAERLRMAVIWMAAVIAVISVSIYYLPERVQKEVDTIDAMQVLDRVSGRTERASFVAWKIWKDHKLFGCGGWGYRHLCRDYMDKQQARSVHHQLGAANVHNDYLQMLAEHGAIGFGLIIAVVVMLMLPVCRVWHQLSLAARFTQSKNCTLPRPRQLFALPAPAFVILVACCGPLAHAFGDCPLRSLAVLLNLFVALAAIPGFLPHDNH